MGGNRIDLALIEDRTMPGPTRRLVFHQIDAIVPEVERLRLGHSPLGRWTLAMICDHLARSVNLTLNFPPSTEPPTRAQAVARRLVFRRADFPPDQPLALPNEQTPDPDADPSTAAEALRVALERLSHHDGPWPSHPVLGPLTRDEWLLFHARHAAHHLGFVVPLLPDSG